MAALLRGVARSIAVVAAAQSGAAAAATQPIAAGFSSSSPAAAAAAVLGGRAGGSPAAVVVAAAAERSKRATVMASLPGLCGSGLSRQVLTVSGSSQQQQQHPLSSSAAFLAYRRLSVRPQAKHATQGSKQIYAFKLKPNEGQVVSVEEPAGRPPSTSYREQPRETWTPTRIPEGGSSLPGNGQMGRSFNSRTRSVSTMKNFGPRARYLNTSVSSDVMRDSEVYGKSPSMPFHTSREFSSSALLDGFDDNEGSDMDVETYKRMHEITTTGNNVPDPVMTFASTGFPPTLMRELENAGFSSPSAIQAMTWPIASQSRDVVAVAKTGSGKTLGYLIPAFLRLARERTGRTQYPSVLVLAPTRELANQIREETVKFGRSSRISCTCVCGGASKGPQLRDIERGVDVIVATPGRLNDLLEMRAVNLKKVSYLVLDEADRMLDMGFEPQIRAIVDQMPPQRQTLMYTATWPHEVRRIARDLLTDPVQVNIGNSDQLSANKSITQKVEIISRYDKEKRLDELLASIDAGSKVLIFCTTKRMCDDLAMNLRSKFGALAIHGDKSQRDRDFVMNQFKRGRTPILVATDVAARGLDIKDIRMVINYDFPTGVEDYVHRIGRTGRAGATGLAHTFFGFEDAKHAGELIKVLESTGQVVSPDLRQMVGRGDSRRGGGSRWGGRYGGSRSQGGYYTGKSDGFSSGSKWGQSDRFGGDRYGNDRFGSGNDRFGSGNDRFGSGNDKFGSGNGKFRSGNDRFGSGNDKFGSGNDRFGSGNDRFGSDRAGGRFVQRDSRVSESSGSASTAGKWGQIDRLDKDNSGGKWTEIERKSSDRPTRKWGQSNSQSMPDLQGLDGYGIDKSLLTPRHELKMNEDGSLSVW